MYVALDTTQRSGVRSYSFTDYRELATTAAWLRRLHNEPMRAIARRQWWRLLTK
jgi:hypothetical protein